MRALAVLLLLALPLAGCTSPAPAPPPVAMTMPTPSTAAAPAPAPSPGPGPAAARAAAADNDVLSCPAREERAEQERAQEVVLTVEGCLAASEPVLVGGLPDDVRVGFNVQPGAKALLVLLHLHGPEPLRAALRAPGSNYDHERADAGTADRDSLLRWDLPAPAAGTWNLKGVVEDLAVGRKWTATIVVAYA